jgi:hypothetical protein
MSHGVNKKMRAVEMEGLIGVKIDSLDSVGESIFWSSSKTIIANKQGNTLSTGNYESNASMCMLHIFHDDSVGDMVVVVVVNETPLWLLLPAACNDTLCIHNPVERSCHSSWAPWTFL